MNWHKPRALQICTSLGKFVATVTGCDILTKIKLNTVVRTKQDPRDRVGLTVNVRVRVTGVDVWPSVGPSGGSKG